MLTQGAFAGALALVLLSYFCKHIEFSDSILHVPIVSAYLQILLHGAFTAFSFQFFSLCSQITVSG